MYCTLFFTHFSLGEYNVKGKKTKTREIDICTSMFFFFRNAHRQLFTVFFFRITSKTMGNESLVVGLYYQKFHREGCCEDIKFITFNYLLPLTTSLEFCVLSVQNLDHPPSHPAVISSGQIKNALSFSSACSLALWWG